MSEPIGRSGHAGRHRGGRAADRRKRRIGNGTLKRGLGKVCHVALNQLLTQGKVTTGDIKLASCRAKKSWPTTSRDMWVYTGDYITWKCAQPATVGAGISWRQIHAFIKQTRVGGRPSPEKEGGPDVPWYRARPTNEPSSIWSGPDTRW